MTIRRDIMQDKATRRQFLKAAGMSGAALSVGNLGFLEKVPPVSAQEARVTPALVRLNAGIEPLVRLIEDTPQAELLEQVAQRIRQGTTYQQVVARSEEHTSELQSHSDIVCRLLLE